MSYGNIPVAPRKPSSKGKVKDHSAAKVAKKFWETKCIIEKCDYFPIDLS